MKEHGAGVRWAAAGRSKEKLDALGVDSLVVDTTDAASVDRMAAATRVVASTAGPFVELEGHNHFTILDELANSQGALTKLVSELVSR